MSAPPAPPSTAKHKPAGEAPSTKPRGSSVLRRPAVRYAVVGAGLLALILASVAVISNRPIQVEVAAVEQNVPVRVFGLGTVEARVMSKIGFEVGATLAELNVDHGDRVTKGQVLARLSLGEQEAKVAKARAALEIAEVSNVHVDISYKKFCDAFRSRDFSDAS